MSVSPHAPLSVGLDRLAHFDAVIDVRSPSEFAEDHIPGALNCPVLDDEERRRVGTLYKQVSPFEARKLGAALVSRNIARHLETHFLSKPKGWKPLVCCWRGGQRSGAMTLVLNQVGWGARQLAGGYKAFRQQVMDDLVALPEGLSFRILCGPTGSGKTALLRRLAAQGGQVLDLEGLAVHKGSVLGGDVVRPQPGQKAFETGLWQALRGFDPARPVWVEAESRRIGRLHLPPELFARLADGRCTLVRAPLEARVAYLLRDYADLIAEPAAFGARLERLIPLHGHERVLAWRAQIDAGDWETLARELIVTHYDPAYRRGGDGLYRHVAQAAVLDAASLDADALDALARGLANAI
ncbi:MAG TPA: tRNA 2-selenouridine(34) synthase MnmH [Rhodocyclaceae bacterium]|nr:tRNA 2-selenouridine(34) synthase MnmH [Rhodocyclaceae bacterium]HMY48696.1 tRNA 2-selenouridine(34) synthase MnmH [Rhodocyclaceae bacterium]HMZ77275.1 tRNA 2-selenouridine(34) synthase MnmH [Rhodocyclaceae bacterium]